MKSLVALLFILFGSLCVSGQATDVNLVENGDFENGNIGFSSDFQYTEAKLNPGYYTITPFISNSGNDFRHPETGDHTSGRGLYMVVNSNGEHGNKAWRCKVNVIPNSNYFFAVYFCNLYAKLPAKTSFAIEGGDVKGNDPEIKLMINGKTVATEADIYHLFRWVKATAVWYSGTNSGETELSIENLNANESGNDLALDDIEFSFIETMPAGYKPFERNTIMTAEYREKIYREYAISNRRRNLNIDRLAKGDSIAPGIYTITYRKSYTLEDSLLANRGEKIQLNTLMFEQSKSDILPQSRRELDVLADWLKRQHKLRIRFSGHTDNVGSAERNQKLSEERVLKVKEYMVSKGIDAGRIETIGLGGDFPIVPNDNEENRKQNRRVEFEILE